MKNKKIQLLIFFSVLVLDINYVLGQNENDWSSITNEDFKIVANDGATDDQFGHHVAIDNGIIAVGMPYDDDNGTDSGAVYLFEASTGNQLLKLLPNDGHANAEFGYSVAIDNGVVAIGARRDNENGTNAGAVYLFNATTGSEIFKLLPNDGEANDEFGNSIDIDNGIVVVGAWRADEYGDASGAAYIFNASTGNQINKLLPNSGNDFQTFGVSIAIDNGIVGVGSRTYFNLSEGYNFAKAYLFDVTNGNLLHTLQPDILNLNGDLGGHFSDFIDMSNGLVAIGAPTRSVVFDHSGAAYIFDVTTGTQLHYIIPNDATDRDNFGVSISIDNGIMAVGAHQDDVNGFNSGSIYMYNATTGIEINKLFASDGTIADLYGCSVALQGDFAVVAAKQDDDNGNSSGSAYVYSTNTLNIDNKSLLKFSLYPNPSSNSITITTNSFINDALKIKIYNSVGQLIRELNQNTFSIENKIVVDISALNSGLYFVGLELDSQSSLKKLIID